MQPRDDRVNGKRIPDFIGVRSLSVVASRLRGSGLTMVSQSPSRSPNSTRAWCSRGTLMVSIVGKVQGMYRIGVSCLKRSNATI